jgi:general secretion pathway protein C
VACCFFAARTLAVVAAGWLTPTQAPPPMPTAASAPKAPGWSDRQVILSRNLFNVSTLAPSGAQPAAEESYEKTRLPLKLLGTAASGDPALSWAAVEDEKSHEHQVVHIGDRLQEQAEVVRIERRRIVLQNGPKLEELALEKDAGDGGPAGMPPTAVSRGPLSASDAIQRLSDNRYRVDRTDMQKLSGNPAALFSQARIVPKYDKGTMVGVQVNAIRPGSLFQQIGIQDGDVITELNGIQVNGPQQSAQVLRELSQASDLKVTVQGANGQTRELEYEIR